MKKCFNVSMKKTIFILSVLLLGKIVAAQSISIIDKMKEKYPDARVVQLEDKTVIEISINPNTGKLDIVNKVYEKQLYLSERASLYSDRSISYNSFINVRNVKATTFIPGEKKYTTVKVKEFKEKEELGGSTFKDDVRKITFRYSGLQYGAISDLYYEEEVTEPRFLSSFYFGAFRPVEQSEFLIIADKNVHIDFKKFNMDKIPYNFTKEEKKGKIYYRFTAAEIPEFDTENDAPNIRYYVPHVIPIIRTYTYKGKEIPVLRNVADLYHWYYGLLKDVNKTIPENVKQLTDSITQGKTDPIDITKAIYYWVQQNIKYVAFEEGLGGFVPRAAGEVCEKRYGDCKDNSSLLFAMLRYKGIRAYYTWIGTRSIPYTYEEVPTPISDNHMICTVEIDGKYYYLDATGNHHPLDLPSSFIQGKEALIGIDSVHYDIDVVPIVPPEKNRIYGNIYISLNDKMQIQGHGIRNDIGYTAVDLRYIVDGLKNEKERKKFAKTMTEIGNNKYLLTDYDIIVNEVDSPVSIKYNFTIDDYVQKWDGEMYINLNMQQTISDYKIPETKKYDKEFEYKISTHTVIEFEIPKGYKVTYIPENAEKSTPWIEYKITYSQKENKIIYVLDFAKKTLLLKKEHFDEWNEMVKSLARQYKEVLVLKKIE